MNSKLQSNESLCEKSMQVVINIVKLSSFSITKMSRQTSGTSLASKNSEPSSIRAAKNSSPSRFPQSLRAQVSQNSSQAVSYPLKPVGGTKSMSVIEEKNVDGMASDYIRKVYRKLRSDSTEMADLPINKPLPSTRKVT